MKKSQLLTPTQVAKLLLVSPITVRQWAQKDLIESQSTPGGHRRFEFSAVERFAQSRGITLEPIAPELAPNDKNPKLKLLIVEDDTQLRSFLVELFNSKDLLLETAASGFEAGVKVSSFAPDIVLLDLMLPGINGIEICKSLKTGSTTKDIRVIAMTGYYSSENIEQILAAGAQVCLKKPLDISLLLTSCGLD